MGKRVDELPRFSLKIQKLKMDMRTLFFTAKHEMWPMVSGCRKMACGVGSGWGALHGEMDDFALGLCDKTGTAGFYSALGDSCGSEGLNMIDFTLEWG